MSDLEILYESDQDVSKHHPKFIEAVAQLDEKQRIKKAERSEPTLAVSEYDLIKSGISNKDAVRVQDLTKSLKQTTHQSIITKKLRSIQKKTKVLSKPLERIAADRIKRSVGFENTKKDLGKWNAIIAKNRTAEQVFFPLNNSSKVGIKVSPTTEFLQRFRLQSDLQKKLEELEPTSEVLPTMEADKYQNTLEEIIMKRKETARFRAQQSYKEAKAHRQRRIKSKKFHRIQRKQKVKQQLKEFEDLRKTNPEEALAKLDQLNRSRAEERMSLRHKNTGQWAKNKQIKARYDKETRQMLSEQLTISRELTQKIKRLNDSDNENEENNPSLAILNNDKKNPWINNIKSESEVDEFIDRYRKYQGHKSQKLQEQDIQENISSKQDKIQDDVINPLATFTNSKIKKSDIDVKIKNVKNDIHCADDAISRENKVNKRRTQLFSKEGKKKNRNLCNIGATSIWHVEELLPNVQMNINEIFETLEENQKQKIDSKLRKIKKKFNIETKTRSIKYPKKEIAEDYSAKLEFKNSKQRPILDYPLDETIMKDNLQQKKNLKNMNIITNEERDKSNDKMEIDPQKYLNVKPKYLKTQMPDIDISGEHALDDNEQEEKTHQIISEAFADDDIVQEFRKEKEEEIKKSQPEDIDLSLPGWGSWAGKNIKDNRSNRKKRQLLLKCPKDMPRKDENKGDVIIFEESNKKLKEHLVNDLPYPFTTVKDFEASIRAPLGRTFIPENAHSRLIQPMINTKLGQVIEPMDEDILIKKQSSSKRVAYSRKDKNNKRNRK